MTIESFSITLSIRTDSQTTIIDDERISFKLCIQNEIQKKIMKIQICYYYTYLFT